MYDNEKSELEFVSNMAMQRYSDVFKFITQLNALALTGWITLLSTKLNNLSLNGATWSSLSILLHVIALSILLWHAFYAYIINREQFFITSSLLSKEIKLRDNGFDKLFKESVTKSKTLMRLGIGAILITQIGIIISTSTCIFLLS